MNKKAIIDVIYVMLLTMTAGAVLVLGAVVAAVVFHSESFLSIPILSRYEEGKIMGEIFLRFSYWAYFMTFVISLYEVSRYFVMQLDRVSILSAFLAVFTLMMFSGVYVPKIMEYQARGELAMDESFETLHKASELDSKLLLVALLVLASRRIYLMATKR